MQRILPYLLVALMSGAVLAGQQSRTAQSAIPGVIAPGTPVEVVRGGFKGLEGPAGRSK